MKKIIFTSLIFLFSLFCPSFAIEEIITLRESDEFKKDIKNGAVFEFAPDKPKKILFANAVINEFSPVLNFQGIYDADFSDEESNFAYPFTIEGGGEIKFGEEKDRIRVVSNFTRNVDDLDKKFLGKLSDIYFERQLNENHRILIGNSRIPIGIEGGRGQYGLLLTQRAQIGAELGNARAFGIRFRGNAGAFDYDLGGYSSTRYLQDITDGAEFAGWVNYKPFYDNKEHFLNGLKIGGGVNTGVSGSGYTVAGSGMEYRYKKFLLNTEYAYANGSNSSKYSPDISQGCYTAAAYNITDKIQVAGRYDIFDPNTKKTDDTIQKYTIGLNYYIIGQRLRFSLDYTYTKNNCSTNSTTGKNRNSIHFMTQVMI